LSERTKRTSNMAKTLTTSTLGGTWSRRSALTLPLFGMLMRVKGFKQTASPVVGKKVKIGLAGSICSVDDDCISGSCFERKWVEGGLPSLCQCKPCFKVGCGGCSTTEICKFINKGENICQAREPRMYLDMIAEVQTGVVPTEVMSNVPSGTPSSISQLAYSPTAAASVDQCFTNSQCEEGFLCDSKNGCQKITCRRDINCSKYDAYCNPIFICAKKKDVGAKCKYPGECRSKICTRNKCEYPSDTQAFSPVQEDLPSLRYMIGAVSSETIAWLETQQSYTKFGLFIAACSVVTGVIWLMLRTINKITTSVSSNIKLNTSGGSIKSLEACADVIADVDKEVGSISDDCIGSLGMEDSHSIRSESKSVCLEDPLNCKDLIRNTSLSRPGAPCAGGGSILARLRTWSSPGANEATLSRGNGTGSPMCRPRSPCESLSGCASFGGDSRSRKSHTQSSSRGISSRACRSPSIDDSQTSLRSLSPKISYRMPLPRTLETPRVGAGSPFPRLRSPRGGLLGSASSGGDSMSHKSHHPNCKIMTADGFEIYPVL